MLGHKLSGAKIQRRAFAPSWRHRLDCLIHRQPLLPLAAATATGVFVDSSLGELGDFQVSPLRGMIWIVLTVALASGILRRRDRLAAILAVLVFVPLAAALHCLHDRAYRHTGLLSLLGSVEQAAVLEGKIDRPASLRRHPLSPWRIGRGKSPWQTTLELNLDRMRMGRKMHPCRGRVLVFVDGDCSHLRPGDALRVFGEIALFSAPSNPGEVDRRSVYRQRRLHARVSCDSIDQLILLGSAPSPAQRLYRLIASIGSRGRELLLEHIDGSSGSLSAALVMGKREFVDESTRDLLLVTGTAHLLSVSGLHLAIVVAIAGWLATLVRLPLSLKIVWILSICFLYTAITGARPPVVRAAILVGTLMIALWMRRSGQPVNTLSLAALILMAINPQLLFNVGVQLSFLAVVTLLTCHGPQGSGPASLQEVFRREAQLQILLDSSRSPTSRAVITGYRWLGQAVWFSCCVTAITAPLVWQHFHVVTPISVVTNVILSPLLFLALASGVTTVLVGLLFEPCAIAPASVCGWTMEVIQQVVETAASIPGSHVWLPAPPTPWVATYYGVVTATMWWTKTTRTSLVRYGWILIWMVLAWSMASRQPPLALGQMEAIFVDVGHGTSVVLRLDTNKVWLYDCGRLGNETYSSRGIDSVLWSLGVRRLEGVFLSHADADHFNALPGVLRRFEVREVLVPVGLFNDPEPALNIVHGMITRADLPIVELAAGVTVRAGRQIIRVLHPPWAGIGGSDNANSLVLRIDRGGRSLVLPGDLESPGTEWLIRSNRPPPGGVLMAPHHGSLRGDTTAVLHWSRPAEVIVSGGQRAERPEVEAMLSQTGSPVHITSQVGSIRARLDTSGRIDLQTWKESPW